MSVYHGRNKTHKNKFHSDNMRKQSMSISEYVERLEDRRSYPARMINGVLEVSMNGHFVSLEEFDKLVPAPIVHSFSHDITNVDKTKAWML